MAIAFARISYHSRSQGHSAVAGAAYRSGTILHDQRTGECHDFQNRGDVVYSKILLPEGACVEFNDREVLWNAVETAETRKNSQVAKDIILALPRDVDLSHQIDLANNFAQYHFVQHGVVADVAIHDHGDGNPHAHIYVSTRRLHGDQFDKYKARDLEPDVARGRVVYPQYWGDQWREFQNRYFVEHNLDLMVDANYIVAMRHQGRVRGNNVSYLTVENQLRLKASQEIALNDPTSVLNLLGTQHAVFSERDIALLISKNTDTQEDYDTARSRLLNHADLILLGPGDDGRDRYTTRANYEREAHMADQAVRLSLRRQHTVQRQVVHHAVSEMSLNTEQADALFHLANSGDICAIVGRAGTGKSYMMRAAKQMWEASGYRVHGMTVSGIAAKGLEAESGLPSYTIRSLKTQLALGSLTLTSQDILVMDEAGMTDLHDMASLVDAVNAAGAQLVLVGDHAQLQPVGVGAPFRAIVEQIGFSELNHIQRQEDSGDRTASVLLSRGSIDQAIDHYACKQQVHLVSSDQGDDDDGGGSESGGGAIQLVADWCRDLTAENIHQRLILAHRNIDVRALNTLARQSMRDAGLLGHESQLVRAVDGSIALSSGDRIIFLRNDRQLGVSNGEFASVLSVNGDHITVRLTDQETRTISFSTDDYHHFNYGYAATVHKSQGTTVDQTFVYVGGRAWDRFLAYVAMTRHRKRLEVYAEKSQFTDLAALKSTLSRAVVKDSVLDWPVSFAIRRGFDPDSILGRFIDTVTGIKQAIRDTWLFVTNYSAFKLSKVHRKSLRTQLKRRELARQVALFVDLRHALGAQANLMKKDLNFGEKFYEHHDYAHWYEQSVLKNQLAFTIKQQPALFEKALDANRISRDALDKMALDYERAQRAKVYIEHYAKGQRVYGYRLANVIQMDLKAHFSHIAYQVEQQGYSRKSIIRQINSDAVAYRRLYQLKKLSVDEKRAFRVVDRYVQVDQDIRASIARAYALGGFDKLSDKDIQILCHLKTTGDKLAHELVTRPKYYEHGLHFYDLVGDKLLDGYQRHRSRIKVKQLADRSLSIPQHDALCAELLSDRRYYPLLAEQAVDWTHLRKRQHSHQYREKLRSLSSDQRRYYQLVNQYQCARINAGIAWSTLFIDKDNQQPIVNTRWQFAMTLSRARDQLAHDMVINSQDCLPFIIPSALKLADIEKHAIQYNDYLSERQALSPVTYRHQRSVLPVKLDYQIIHDALINLGEDFYIRVLGEHYKRSGQHLRFGRRGSLNVTLSGSHAGNWHSFETDEGGGPIQLLMNATYGWGLPFKEALQEGARLAGLSLEPALIHVKPSAAFKPSPKPDDKSDKIARARYYYHAAQSITGTLGERYLREHRHIVGELSAFRFHPAIRDDYVDEKGHHHVSYHPGIVVGAHNSHGEITAVQTILLDPLTANKVPGETVGAVKRTRGDLKGSAVLVHSGGGNTIIIAEGPETAASLMQIEPNANIYVTLGNIKNAAKLGWLAKKHQTDTFYFAADNDGPNALNHRAIQAVAQSLQDQYGIQSRLSTPTLPNIDKCDFNDVLREKGLAEVKQQWNQSKPIYLPKSEKRQIIPTQEIHDRLHDEVDEWERLATLKSTAMSRVITAKSRLDQAALGRDRTMLERGYKEAVQSLCHQKKLFFKVKTIAPALADTFEKINQPAKAVSINWLSTDLDVEFDTLRQSKDKTIQHLVNCRDKLVHTKNLNKEKLLHQQLESTALAIAKYPTRQKQCKQLAPKLASKLLEFSKFKSRQKDIGRDL